MAVVGPAANQAPLPGTSVYRRPTARDRAKGAGLVPQASLQPRPGSRLAIRALSSAQLDVGQATHSTTAGTPLARAAEGAASAAPGPSG
jgi:hypothetical protein